MNTINTFEEGASNRRGFLRRAAMGLAAAEFVGAAFADSPSGLAKIPPVKSGTHTSFGPIKQIDAGPLNIGYAEAGPAGGPAVILLHGWPYDIYSFVSVAILSAVPQPTRLLTRPVQRSRFGINTISPRISDEPATRNTCTIS